MKNWKKRHFTLLNEADNFEIQYYKFKGDAKMLMGTISCTATCYHVEVFTAEDIELYGPFGLKLVPFNDTHRCWYFIAEDEENKKEWEEVFSIACRKARPQSKHHSIISEAFRTTFESVRHSYGYFNRLEAYGTEEEMLSDFIIQILHRELLEDTINSVRPGSHKLETVKKIKQLASRTVSQSAAKTWKKSASLVLPAVKKMTALSQEIVFDDESSDRFLSILQAEDKVRARLTAAVSKIVDPVLIDVATTLCAPLLANIVVPISQAFQESIKGFRNDMQQLDLVAEEKVLLCELDCAHRRVNHLSGSFVASRDLLWDMYTSNCSNLLSASNGLDAYDLYCEIADSLRQLVHNAIHQFGVLILKRDPESGCAEEMLSDVCVMMRTDAKIIQRNVLGLLLNRLIEPMVQEMIVIPSTDVIQQFNDSECDFLNVKGEDVIQTCGERIIENMISNFLKSLVNEFLPP